MFKEQCWIIYGIKLGAYYFGLLKYESEGEVCSVEFNWKKGMNRFLLGWFHTHPSHIDLLPSEEDSKTMRSWVRSLEKPLLCGIRHGLIYNVFEFKRWGQPIYYQCLSKSKLIGLLFIGKK
jgi:hypothetical protein